VIRIRKEIPYPHHEVKTTAGDIGLIFLATSSKATPANLSDVVYPDVVNPLSVMGWGAVKTMGEGVADLRIVKTPVVPLEVCKTKYETSKDGEVIGEGHVCGGMDGTGFCLKDSGGPLFADDAVPKVYGLVSSQDVCGDTVLPDIYVNVAHYRPWIDEVLRTYQSGEFMPWDDKQPDIPQGRGSCVKLERNGRWDDTDCMAIKNFACFDGADWVLSATKGRWKDGFKACPGGYHFGLPRDYRDIRNLIELMETLESVWINLTDEDADGVFILDGAVPTK
jgi:hypothetical protein